MTHALAIAVWIGFMDAPRFEFHPDPNRLVEFVRGRNILVGRLDPAGEFTQEYTIAFPESGILHRSGPFRPKPIGVGSVEPQPVYELRSGVLIPGTMAAGGPFVPKAGGKIIRFADYNYSPTAPPIWNLPGFFRPVGAPLSGPTEVMAPSSAPFLSGRTTNP